MQCISRYKNMWGCYRMIIHGLSRSQGMRWLCGSHLPELITYDRLKQEHPFCFSWSDKKRLQKFQITMQPPELLLIKSLTWHRKIHNLYCDLYQPIFFRLPSPRRWSSFQSSHWRFRSSSSESSCSSFSSFSRSSSSFCKAASSAFCALSYTSCCQCCGSVRLCCGFGSGSTDPCLWLMVPNPDPAIFVIDLQDANK